MKLIVGLGNPGREYLFTRHNIGFMAVDVYVHQNQGSFKIWSRQKNSEIAELGSVDRKILVQKPLTYMNLSGEAVGALVQFYKIDVKDICVIHDELDLEFDVVRLKNGGGAGGHNGLRSIMDHLGTGDFSRVRMGIGKPSTKEETSDFVLASFSKREMPVVESMIERAIQAIEGFIEGPAVFLNVMNILNRKNSNIE